MSATLNEDVKLLKKLFLHNPVTLKLQESILPSSMQLIQYQLHCEEEDKFVLIYTLFKLKLISGKTILFVNSVDKCYRLKLFLDQFGIRACVLNSELPANCRCHIVSQFNEGNGKTRQMEITKPARKFKTYLILVEFSQQETESIPWYG